MNKEQQKIFLNELGKYGITDWWETAEKNSYYWYKNDNTRYLFKCTPLMALISGFPFELCDYPIEVLKEFNDKWIDMCFEFGWVKGDLMGIKPSTYKAATKLMFGIDSIQPKYCPKYAVENIRISATLLHAAIFQGKWDGVLTEDNFDELYCFVKKGILRHNEAVKNMNNKIILDPSCDMSEDDKLDSTFSMCVNIGKCYKTGDYHRCASDALKIVSIVNQYLNEDSRKNVIRQFENIFKKEAEIVADIEPSSQSICETKQDRVYLSSNEILLSYNENGSHYRLRFSPSASEDIIKIGFFGYSLMLSPDKSRMFIKLSKEGIHGTIKPYSNSSVVINHKKMIYTIREFFGLVDRQAVITLGTPEITSEYIKFELLKQ